VSSQQQKKAAKAQAAQQKAAQKAADERIAAASGFSGVGQEAPQRNLLQEGRDGLQLMREAYPVLYSLQNEWNPQFAQLEARTGAARSQAETAGVQASGTSIRDAIVNASPEMQAGSTALLAQLGDVGASPLEQELQNQALSDLKMGGQLSPEETRAAIQSARGASSARGLGQGVPAAVLEVLNRDAASRGRLNDRRSFAAGVDTNSTQRKAGDRSFTLNAINQSQAMYDPYQRIYGSGGSQASGQVSGPAAYGNYLSAAGGVGTSNQNALLDMFRMNQAGYQFDTNRADSIAFSGVNLNNANANAAAARSNATTNALLSNAGSIASAYVKNR
jgi:hypothetical protein